MICLSKSVLPLIDIPSMYFIYSAFVALSLLRFSPLFTFTRFHLYCLDYRFEWARVPLAFKPKIRASRIRL